MELQNSYPRIIKILKQISSNQLINFELFINCKTVCSERNNLGIDPENELFDIFITIDSELDEFPTSLPKWAANSEYLEKCRIEVEKYVGLLRNEILSSSRSLLAILSKRTNSS